MLQQISHFNIYAFQIVEVWRLDFKTYLLGRLFWYQAGILWSLGFSSVSGT